LIPMQWYTPKKQDISRRVRHTADIALDVMAAIAIIALLTLLMLPRGQQDAAGDPVVDDRLDLEANVIRKAGDGRRRQIFEVETEPELPRENVVALQHRQVERIAGIRIDLGKLSLTELMVLEDHCDLRFMEAHTDLTIIRDTIARRFPDVGRFPDGTYIGRVYERRGVTGANPGYDPKEDGEQGKSMLEKVEREREAAS
jgi:hypothetical protein